jgi:hypothetical protein
MSGIVVFLENKVISSLELWLHYQLENLITIDTEAHLSVLVVGSVKGEV